MRVREVLEREFPFFVPGFRVVPVPAQGFGLFFSLLLCWLPLPEFPGLR